MRSRRVVARAFFLLAALAATITPPHFCGAAFVVRAAGMDGAARRVADWETSPVRGMDWALAWGGGGGGGRRRARRGGGAGPGGERGRGVAGGGGRAAPPPLFSARRDRAHGAARPRRARRGYRRAAAGRFRA